MDWGSIDVMCVIHALGANKLLLFQNLDSEDKRAAFKILSPYIAVRIATESEKSLFTDERDCIIAKRSDNANLYIMEYLYIEELYRRFEQVTRNNICGMLKFKTNFLQICEKEFDYVSCLQSFDKGVECICVTDSAGKFLGSFEEHDLKKNFFGKTLPRLSEIFYQYGVGDAKKEVAELFMKSKVGRIPVLADREILGFYDRLNNACEQLATIDFGKDRVINYFEPYPRLMLSSERCNIEGIFDTLTGTNEIIILNETNINRLYDGSVDLLVCAGEPISGSPIPCIGIEQVYLDLISAMAADKLYQEGVELVVMYIPKKKQIPGWQYMVQGVTEERDFYVAYRNGEMCINHVHEDRYASVVFKEGIYSYTDFKTDTLTLEEGYRWVCGQSGKNTVDYNKYRHVLYMAGYCPLLGMFSKDENTIASELQRLCDVDRRGYRLVQCACPALNTAIPQIRSEINIYMNLLQRTFFAGDIVCVSGLSCFKNILQVRANFRPCYSADAFLRNRTGDCFADNSVSHLTTTGNRVYAQWLYKEVLYDLFSKE